MGRSLYYCIRRVSFQQDNALSRFLYVVGGGAGKENAIDYMNAHYRTAQAGAEALGRKRRLIMRGIM